jgi:Leucine Rich repeat
LGLEVDVNPLLIVLHAQDTAIETWLERFAALLDREDAAQIQYLRFVFDHEHAELVIEALTRGATQLTGLRGLELGADALPEIGDITPVLLAYPHLESLSIFGQGPELGRVQHEHLRELEVSGAGVASAFVEGLLGSNYPNLERLSLDLGGWSSFENIAFQLLYTENIFPRLTKLRLQNAALADELLQGIASSPVLEHLQELDLSHGALSDDGAWALMRASGLGALRKMVLKGHAISGDGLEALRAFLHSRNIELLES